MNAEHMPPTLILGLGNALLGDDGIGCRVALSLQADGSPPETEIDVCERGGLSLMERMLGSRRVILVDALTTGASPRGSVSVWRLESLPNPAAGHMNSAHETSLQTALEMARLLGADVPEEIWVVAVETDRIYEFSEELSPEVAAALPRALAAVRALLKEGPAP